MKHLINLILTLFVIQGLQAQNKNILVIYKVNNGAIENQASLLSDGERTLFVTDSVFHENKEDLKADDKGTYHLQEKTTKIAARSLYSKKDSPILYLKVEYNNITRLYKDSLPDYSWNLVKGETKKIGDFVCHKAVTQFRGSKVVAWYTPEIPISFGPWKLKGLPGLILELYNPDGPQMMHWTAETIKYPYHSEEAFKLDPPIREFNVNPYKTLIVSFEKKIIGQSKRMDAADPRGTSTETESIKRQGIEKKFEWEK